MFLSIHTELSAGNTLGGLLLRFEQSSDTDFNVDAADVQTAVNAFHTYYTSGSVLVDKHNVCMLYVMYDV